MRGFPALLAVLVVSLLAGPALAQPDLDQMLPVDSKITMGKLENGLTYYIRPNNKPENRAELRLVVNAGSILEEDDQQGLAHFLEHMAFNGTKNFEANDLISYLESIGSRFGPDINAYTSFDETVYMLEIPTDKEGLLEKGVLVLSDWAHTITMAADEVEKERGVVLEEWRRGRGAQERLRREHWPVLLGGSRYAERLPIGTPEVIEGAPGERLRAFYEDWYRPELMAVVAVGTFETEAMEALIKEYFSVIPASKTPTERPTYTVPTHEEMRASAATDPEMPYHQVSVYYKHPHMAEGTRGAYRQNIIYGLLGNMLNARLNEILEKPNAPFKYAASGAGSFIRTVDMYQAFAVTDAGQVEDALRALMTEIRRAQVHGFSEGELERAKADRMAGVEKLFNERDKTESPNFAGEYIRNFLEDEPIPGIEAEFELTKEFLPTIGIDDLNEAISRTFHANDMVVQASEPEKDGVTTVESATLLAILGEMADLVPEPYMDTVASGELVPVLPAPGEVTKRREETELGATVLTLSNGIEVWLKVTDFKNDEVVFAGQSRGGDSQASKEDYASATLAIPLVNEGGLGEFTPSDLEKKLSGKIVSVSPYIGTFSQGFRGSSTPKDLETAFQLMYLYFTSPNERPEAFEVLKGRYQTFIANRLARPETRFSDKVMLINYSDHYMYQPPTQEYLDAMDREKALAFYRDFVSDASDYRFFFVGAFDMKTIEPMIVQYLGSLPSQPDTPREYKDVGLRFPEGVVRETVLAGAEPKSQTVISWPALTGLDEFEMFYLRKANDILEIRLRDILREELGGTYSVGVGISANYPYPDYGTTSVSFGSSPENAPRLIETVFAEVAKFKEEGPTQEEVDKVKEQEYRGLETGQKQNGYWLGSFTTLDLLGWDFDRILKRRDRIDSVSIETLHSTFSNYYSKNDNTVITLYPENHEPQTGSGSR
jgi:zinc protease